MTVKKIFIATDDFDNIVAVLCSESLGLAEAYLEGAEIQYTMIRAFNPTKSTKRVQPIVLTVQKQLVDPTSAKGLPKTYTLVKDVS